jgi:hypothetical protein
MNRYFELPHEVENKLPAIITDYIKKRSLYLLPVNSLTTLLGVPLFDKPDQSGEQGRAESSLARAPPVCATLHPLLPALSDEERGGGQGWQPACARALGMRRRQGHRAREPHLRCRALGRRVREEDDVEL